MSNILPEIIIESQIKSICTDLKIGLIRATVVNCETNDALWNELLAEAEAIKSKYELLQINSRPAIAFTRKLYRTLGKDPSRYRVASEALCRRVIKGSGLYRLTALVDLINIVSMRSGYAISGLDADKLEGNKLILGVGRADELYHGIGRGELNIESMPVYRDALGGVATPTSDEERTKITPETTHVQININAFGPEQPMDEAVAFCVDLLKRYASATDIVTSVIE